MPAYSRDLEGPDGNTYVPSHEFPSTMRAGDTFDHDGWTLSRDEARR
jgi:hypothetical protein